MNEAVYDKVIITKDLVDTADLALRDTFSFTVEGHDSDNVLQFTQTVSVTANTKTITGWMGSLEIDQLPFGLTYTISEQQEANFATPVITSVKTVAANTASTWHFDVENTRVLKEILVSKTWTDVDNNPLSTIGLDPDMVDLVDSVNPTVILETVTLNNTNNWMTSFGHFNEFTEAGVKINYAIMEHAVDGYTNSNTFDSALNQFILVNRQVPGGVILTKVNAQNNTLQHAVFELYKEDDTLIDTYTSDVQGQILVEDLAVGTYYFKERTAPVGYQLNTDKQHFEIKIGQKEAVSLTVVNIEIPEDSKPPVRGTENPNTGQSNDTQYYLYLMAIGAFLLLILRKKKTVNVIKELNK